MLIVPLNLPSVPVGVVPPPQTASSSPNSTGNTSRDGPYLRLNISDPPASDPSYRTTPPRTPRRAHCTVNTSSARCGKERRGNARFIPGEQLGQGDRMGTLLSMTTR